VKNLERDDDLTCEINVTRFGSKALEGRGFEAGFACKADFKDKTSRGFLTGKPIRGPDKRGEL
jgi:hypothetical protein